MGAEHHYRSAQREFAALFGTELNSSILPLRNFGFLGRVSEFEKECQIPTEALPTKAQKPNREKSN